MRSSPTPTSGSSPASIDELLAVAAPVAARGHGRARRSCTPDGRALPLGARPAAAVDRRRARAARLGVAGQPVDGALPPRAGGAPGAAGGLAVGFLPARRPRGLLVRRRLRPRLLHVLRGRRPRRAARAAGAGCTSTRRPPSSCTRAATRPGASRTACSGCTTPARCATSAGQYPGRRHAPLRGALRAGLGARMLVSYVSGRVPPVRGSSGGPPSSAPPGPRPVGGLSVRHAVIMAGGSGTRLWPLSRAEPPQAAPRRRRRTDGRRRRTACWPRRSTGCGPCSRPSGSGSAPRPATATRCARRCPSCAPTG